MIIGLGTDIIDVDRVEKLISKGDTYLQGIFTDLEITYCRSKHYPQRHFAGRFAAKEAFLKALGTGYRDGIGFSEIEIVNDSLGKPVINVSGHAHSKLCELASTTFRTHLSLAHVKSMATATVIIETEE